MYLISKTVEFFYGEICWEMCPLGKLELLQYDNVSHLVGIRQVGVSEVASASWELHLLMGFEIIGVEPPTSPLTMLSCIMRRGVIYLKPCLVAGVVISVIKSGDLLHHFVISFNV